jgi:hypothetical protein
VLGNGTETYSEAPGGKRFDFQISIELRMDQKWTVESWSD